MSGLFDYLYAMEALPEEAVTAQGFGALIFGMAATGCCGAGTPGERPFDDPVPGREWEDGYQPDGLGLIGAVLPFPELAGAISWAPAGDVLFPALRAAALTPAWSPAWGEAFLPSPAGLGSGAIALVGEGLTPALFALGGSGAAGDMTLPPLYLSYGGAGFDPRMAGQFPFPAFQAHGYDCALSDEARFSSGSAAVTALLCRGEPDLIEAASALTAGLGANDAKAARILAYVSANMVYEKDADSSGIGDSWMCAAAAWHRGRGDCEDGAVLIHGLLLAAGVPAPRLVTVFGKAGLDLTGHAWTAYKREADEVWTLLDWTAGIFAETAGLPAMLEARDYKEVDYALNAGAFFAVRRTTAEFFSKNDGAGLSLAAFTCSGATNAAGRGTGTLFKSSVLWAGAECLALAGAVTRVDGAPGPDFPLFEAAGRGGWRNGRSALPGLGCRAGAGAAGTAEGPALKAAGRTGSRGRAALAPSRLACAAQADPGAVRRGRGELPLVRGRALGTAGIAGHGAAKAAALRLGGVGLAGALACGQAVFAAATTAPDAFGRLEVRGAIAGLGPGMQGDAWGTADTAGFEGLIVMSGKGAIL